MDEIKNTQQVLVAVPQTTREDFLNWIVTNCASYKWPKGAIECIDPDKTRLVFLWGNRFKGYAEGGWTAKVNGTHKVTVNKNEVQIKDGTPYSGSLPQVEFDLLVINDNQATPYWAKDFTKVGFNGANFQPEAYVSAAGGTIEGDNLGNSLTSWMKYGNEITDDFLIPIATDLSTNTAMAYLALNVLPAEVIQKSMDMFSSMKFDSRDVGVTSRNSVTEDPTPVLVPFYLLEFQFEGKSWRLAMMADKRGNVRGQVPPVKNADKITPEEIVEEEMPGKIKQAKMIKWGWILAILLLFVVNFTVAVVYLIAWFIGYWFFKKPIKDRIKELRNQEADDSRRTAELLRKQLLKK